MYEIRLIPKENIFDIIPLLQVLDPKISAETLQERLTEMITHNYQCVGVYDGQTLIGISGIWILYKYYVGKHLEADDVVILPEYRSKGVGEQLSQWIDDYARSQGCVAAELNVYVGNKAGIRFWIRQGYNILGFHCH